MKERLVIVGAGGHAKSVFDSVDQEKYQIVGFLDDRKSGTHMGFPILGQRVEDVCEYRSCKYIVAIGDIPPRKLWFERLQQQGLDVINIIDKSALVSPSARIGKGNFIGKYAIINADAVIGDNNVINTRALVEHECVVGSHTHLSTNSVINGNVIVQDGVFLGSCAVCIGQLTVGKNTVIGAGSVIIKDVEPEVTVVGVPGKIIKRSGKDG